MKKIFTTLLAVIAIAHFSYGQVWTRSASDTTNIYNLNSGKVDIGATGGSSKLNVAGDIKATINSSVKSSALFSNDDSRNSSILLFNNVSSASRNFYLGTFDSGSSAANTFQIRTSTYSSVDPSTANPVLTVTDGGNVGIGTKTPNNLFEIRRDDTSGPELGLTNANAINGNKATIRFQLTSGGVAGASIASIFQNYSTGRSDLTFSTHSGGGFSENMRILGNGKVGIGTTSPDEKLTVKGKIHSEEVRVDLSVPAPDYVFENDYKLPALNALKSYIDKNHHLPEIPSAKEFAKDGLKLGEMNTLLLKKVEELTLYLIEQDKQLKRQTERMNKLEKQLPKTNKRK